MHRTRPSQLLAGLVAGALCSASNAQPSNDACANAMPITLGGIEGSTLTATPDAGGSGCTIPGPDVFYRWIAPATCQFEIQTCDGATDFDTILSVHQGCPATQSNMLQCDDDGCDLQRSRILLNAIRGTTYTIRVTGFPGDRGKFALTLRQLGRPANDSCFAAHPISGASGTAIGETTCAMPDGIQSCIDSASSGSAGVYYRWTAPAHGVVTFDTCGGGTTFDSFLSASSGCPHTDQNVFVCSDDFCGQRSSITFGAVQGASYLIRVSGFGNAVGNFVLNWAFGSNGGIPPNDTCVNAQPISIGSIAGTTVGGHLDNPGVSCAIMGNDVYYRFRAPLDTRMYVLPCESNPSGHLAISVHDGCPPTVGNQVSCTTGFCDPLSFEAKTGIDYYLRVGYVTNPAPFTFTIIPDADAVVFDPSTLSEYYLVSDFYDATNQRFVAQSLGGNLASIASSSENQFITKSVMRAGNVSRLASIGLSDRSQEGVFRWDDSSPFNYSFFLAGQPDNFAGAENFVHLFDYTGAWNDYGGVRTNSVYGVGESTRQVESRVFNPANGHLYLRYRISSWEGAQARARAMGGNLVTINDIAENEFVRSNVANGNPVWIGLNDAETEGSFRWADGSTASFRNFPSGLPDDRSGIQDYVTIHPVTGHWNDQLNIRTGAGVHGVAEIILPNTVGAPVRGPRGCGNYVLVGPTNFYPALFAAERLGGRLVSIGSAEKNEFIRSTFAAPGNRRLWLGGTDRDDDGNFSWLDGEAFTYSNFLNGEPNNLGGNEDYLEMFSPSTGTWNDISTLDNSAPLHFAVIEIECACDWNANAFVDSQDFFDFLSAFFDNNADFNCDHFVNSQDLFDFLTCLLAGCA